PSGIASPDSGPSGAWSCMPISYSPLTTTSARADWSPWRIFTSRVTLPPGWSCGAFADSACSGSVTGLSTWYSTRTFSAARRARGHVHGGDDLCVAGAAADVACQRFADLGVGRSWHALQQVVRGDDQAWRAKTALHRAGFDKRLLDLFTIQSFDRHQRAAVGLAAQHKAGTDQGAVKVDRARSALSLLACVLRPVKAEPLAQYVKQALALPHAVSDLPAAVDGAFDLQAAAHAHVKQRRASTERACRR